MNSLVRHTETTKNRCNSIQLATVAITLLIPMTAASSDTVKICDDLGEWPPFTYFARANGEATTEIKGFTVSLVDRIFTEAGINYSIELLPWKRCLSGVETGTYNMLLNATYNDDRAKIFLFSEAHSTITPNVFFLKSSFPDGPKVEKKADLKNYKIGGIHGYNYDYYGLTENDVINKGIYNYESLVTQLNRGHISIFVENLEILAGFKLVGKNYLEYNMGHKPIKDMPPTPVYMLFNKSNRGEQLKQLIDSKLPTLSGGDQLTTFMTEADKKQ
jgi:polar amino acid transport system substrate-binding protein